MHCVVFFQEAKLYIDTTDIYYTFNQLYEHVEREIELEENDPSDYYFYNGKTNLVNADLVLNSITETGCNEFSLISKDDFERVDEVGHLLLPSIIHAAAQIKPGGMKLLNLMEKYRTIHEDVYDPEEITLVFSMLPMDQLDGKEDIELAKEALDWFNRDVFKLIPLNSCRSCGQPTTIFKKKALPTMLEVNYKAHYTDIYQCHNCGAFTRVPNFKTIERIIELKSGNEIDCVALFASILVALKFNIRIVFTDADTCWIEFWSSSNLRYVHIDPVLKLIDAPLYYKEDLNMNFNFVIAIGQMECRDVIQKYTQLPLEDIEARSKDFCGSVVDVPHIVTMRNNMWSMLITAEEIHQLNELHNQDMNYVQEQILGEDFTVD